MELFATCIGLAVFAFAGIGALLGWLAYARLGKLEARLLQLERSERATSPDRARAGQPDAAQQGHAAAAPSSPSPLATSPSLSRTVAPTVAPGVPPIPAPPSPLPSGNFATEAPRSAPPSIPVEHSVTAGLAYRSTRAEPPNATESTSTGSRADEPARTPPPKPFELERWLGVRGAAVLGGIFLAIAGFLFLQHSIERGWVTPKARVITATLTGLACFIASSRLRRREYTITANAIAGAGAVILYAAAWASSMLYGFVSPFVSFAAMGAVTAACIYISWKHASQIVAVLGLVGGFATPLVLSTGQDRPFGLFGYVLLLDLAFLFLAGRRRWPAIGMVALIGTTLIQGLWVAFKMDPEEKWIGLGMLGLFAITFASFATTRASSERKGWLPAQTGAVLLPFAFVLYFAQSLALAIPLGAMALLAALLCCAAGILARRDEARWLPIGAASGSAALLITWAVARPAAFDIGTSWLVAGCSLGIAALQHAFAEWRRRDSEGARTITPGAVAGAATSAITTLALAVYASLEQGALATWPWFACFAATALLLLRQAALSRRFELAWIGAFGAGAALALQRVESLGAVQFERDTPILVAIVGLGAALLFATRAFAARVRAADGAPDPSFRAGMFAAAASFFVPAMFAVWWPDTNLGTFEPQRVLALAVTLVLACGGLIAASCARMGVLFLAVVVIAWMLQFQHAGEIFAVAASTSWWAIVGLVLATTLTFGAWPFATRACWRHDLLTWFVAVVQTFAGAFVVAAHVEARTPNAFRFATPLLFALGTAWMARTLWRASADTDELAPVVLRRARITATAAALLYACAVVPVHIDREPAAVTLALFGAALSVFWVRVASRTALWIGVAALVFALLRLAVISEPWSFAVPPRPVLNWNAWIYLVPAACATFAAVRLRAQSAELADAAKPASFGTRPIHAGIAGIAAVVLFFVWLNVEVSARFAIGERVGLRLPHGEGRALATSIAWALYALALLAIGVTRRSSGPRWASLLLFLTTIGKVFLFDLGHLEGLQRAASMLGLALSLITVSLVYQRFVFRRLATPPVETPPTEPPPNPAPAS